MEIREYTDRDFYTIQEIHRASGLPVNCLPDFANPLFLVKRVVENGSGIMVCGAIKLTGELYVLVDHSKGDPESRWEALKALTASGLLEASRMGIDDVTAFVPPEIEKSFAKRLLELQFVRSPWPSYTKILGQQRHGR